LIDSVPSDYATMGFVDITELESALSVANAIVEAGEATAEEIESAYNTLAEAIGSLVLFDEDVFVEKVESISDNSIRGMDVSSFGSMMATFDYLNEEAGEDKYGFRDYEGNLLARGGFFVFLKKQGVNYIRIRVWNDPMDAEGNGYGGGNNNLTVAKKMGRYATKAGMDVLIDFHFSDFWADPGKQKAPKAWADYTVEQKAEAIATMTEESLNELLEYGVNVTMVQIGNETNGKFCGESDWDSMNLLFDAGCDIIK